MDNDIPEINELIQQFSKLPGLGPKSAKRIILKLINNKDNMVKPLAKSLAQVYKKVVRCIDCGNLKIIDRVCICSSDNAYDKICVVENLADMWAIESSSIYKGHFHILGGTLSSNENYEQKNFLNSFFSSKFKKTKSQRSRRFKCRSIAKENEAKTKTELTSLTRDDPLSNPTFKRLAMTLPHTKRQTTRLVCRVTGQVMDEDNPPMLLPNGYVYSKKGVDFLLKKGQVLYCPRTGDGPFEKQEVKKAFVA